MGKIFASMLQNGHVLKKLNFALLTSFPRGHGRRGAGYGQNISCHVAAFVILFNLICNMTMF